MPGLVARFGLRRLVPLEPTVAQSRGPAIWGNGPPTAPIAPGERPAGVYDGGPGCYIWLLGAGHGVRTEVRAPGHATGARQTLTVSPRPEPSRVAFEAWLRPQQAFDDLDDLVAQMGVDVESTRRVLSS